MPRATPERPSYDVGALGPAGLGSDEHQVYEALLGVTSTNLEGLAAAVELDAPVVARAVDILIEHGMAGRVESTGLIHGNAPEGALEAALRQRERELHLAFAELRRLTDRYRSTPRDSDGAEGLLEIVRGSASITRRFAQLHEEAEREVLVFVRPPYVVDEENEAEQALLAEGLRARAVYDLDLLESPESMAILRRNMQRGEEARLLRDLPVKGMIVDSARAFLPLSLSADDPVFAVVHAPSLLEALNTAFEVLWDRAIPLLPSTEGVEPAVDHPTGYVEAPDRQILALSLAGLTDEAVARQLGLGVRTVQRRIRALMDQLGAQTRMQLGWTAARLSLLDAPDQPDLPTR